MRELPEMGKWLNYEGTDGVFFSKNQNEIGFGVLFELNTYPILGFSVSLEMVLTLNTLYLKYEGIKGVRFQTKICTCTLEVAKPNRPAG